MSSAAFDTGAFAKPAHEPAPLRALIAALRGCWRSGTLHLTGPRGTTVRLEGAEPGLEAGMRIRSLRFLRRVGLGGDVGFADSFIEGEWDSPDLAACLTAFATNFDALAELMNGHPLLRLMQGVAHRLNRNSRAGSRRNIQAHYDLGDDFYAQWLDAGMNYSSVLSLRPGESLEAAQTRKHAALARAMDLRRGQSVLEIGCGWGGFAEFAAREYDARVTAVTISPSQYDHAARRIQAAGLGDRVEVRLQDYRDVAGRFDRVASIEMFEAVGERYWPTFFERLRERMAEGGRAGLQIITIEDALFERYRRRPDFIQLYVFPGGMLPSERRLREETGRAGLAWTGIERFGAGYADTLKAWHARYRARTAEVAALGFDDRFDRMWRYYLAYCEAGFRTGRTDVIQLGLARR